MLVLRRGENRSARRGIGGSGFSKLETAYKSTTIGLETYLRNTDDALLQLVLQHETKKKLYSIQKEAEKFRREFEVPNLDRAANERVTKFARRVKQKVKQQAQDIEVKQWEEKELHGRYPKRIREADVDDYKNQPVAQKCRTEG